MGTSIHMCIEQREGNGWKMLKIFDLRSPARHQNYDRFAALAGVLVPDPENYPKPRGAPERMSEEARKWIEEWEEHNALSWLTLKEACAIYLDTQDGNAGRYEDAPEMAYFGVDTAKNRGDHRVIFFFN